MKNVLDDSDAQTLYEDAAKKAGIAKPDKPQDEDDEADEDQQPEDE